VANDAVGLTILNVLDPAHPVIVGNVDTPTEACDVGVSGNYAYVKNWYTGLQVVDITDPATPTIVWSRNREGEYFEDIAVSGNYAYISISDRLEVWNITDPANPVAKGFVVKGDYLSGTGVRSGYVSGNYAYIGDTEDGLMVVDLNVCGLRYGL
jgi:hypothetical protein